MPADLGRKIPFSLRAEVMLLLIITIFGLIGLSFCIGLYGNQDNLSANISSSVDYHLIAENDRENKT